ncbi:hypothetical protein NZL82_08320 [Sphingomonas sanguinis]|uniref:hypothetical protein n=1 Tax=Sphingomonas sp. LC-1 TaxID=3110957 RepID=UPI0021BB6411|nr:hypothetical protein [Sphingomonas sp. LC-1]MCT8001886.1 hypothetical protein [Sphingomonas sp. LC-1]
MKAMILAGLGFATIAVPSVADAQRWTPIAQRQGQLQTRIDQGIRSGALDRREAVRLRSQLRDLSQLEYRYRRSGGGLSASERNDLDRRYAVLSRQVRFEKHDRFDRHHRR